MLSTSPTATSCLSRRRPRHQPARNTGSVRSILIEIGKNSEIADAGFALPTEEKKYAISQQMVIYKTEQLLKSGLQNGV
jgi:hypothetical protein